jgi:hypothetical protein
MRKGEESLKLEVARRRAAGEEERSRIPPPPGRSSLTFGRAAGSQGFLRRDANLGRQ